MSRERKRVFYISLAAFVTALFVAGLVAGYLGRHSTICPDGKPPRQQQDTGLGQIEYLCHNGKIVTK
jgi:hypothetical protein